MSSEQARHAAKRAVFGFALAVPLLAGCAYDDGYYDDGYYGRPDYGYGYGYYGYGYGYPCGWPYDCDRWHHRRHHHHHGDDDDDGNQHGGDDGGSSPPPGNPGGHASNVIPRTEFLNPPDVESPGSPPRSDRRGTPPGQIWIPPQRDSRR